jgi:hypothetical protein
MAKSININPALFWDIEFSELDYEKNARQIIERVLSRGSMNDWFEIKSYYGIMRLKKEVVRIRSLDKVTLNFCSKYFNLPKNHFKCYNTPQLYHQLWNY